MMEEEEKSFIPPTYSAEMSDTEILSLLAMT